MLSTRSTGEHAINEKTLHNTSSRRLTRILNKTSLTSMGRHHHAAYPTENQRVICDLGSKYLFLTVDYTPPVVNDPHLFGKLAASRAVSSLFACGGQPLIANSIRACDQESAYDERVIAMMDGAQSVMDQFGIAIDGGHATNNLQPLLGFSVVGEVEKNRMRSNNSARVGDLIVVTKPIGLGIFAHALKEGLLPETGICPGIMQSITEHNALGRVLSIHPGVSSMTDIAELGLIGHLAEMIRPAEVDAMLCHRRIPYLNGIQKIAATMTGNAGDVFGNMKRYAPHLVYHAELPIEEELLIHDPQPNGGLLFTVDRHTYTAHRQSWSDICPSLCVIGEMVEGNGVIEVH